MSVVLLVLMNLVFGVSAFAQSNQDAVYTQNIKTVQLRANGSLTDYPIIELQGGYLDLSFDDLDADTKDYYYKIIHCNANWEPSEEIDPMDYIEGYQENRFYDLESSFSTKVPYTKYTLRLPNDDMKWLYSGNYLLKVYLDNDDEDIVFTRRFMVLDNKMTVVPQLRRAAIPPHNQTHQELFFTIQHAGLVVTNPAKDVSVRVLQNGRWDNAQGDFQPTRIGRESIVYNQPGMLLFPAYKEFRPLDLRSYRFRTQQVREIVEDTESFNIYLYPNAIRYGSTHIFTHDINGMFWEESHDNPNARLQGEYASVHFSLKASSPYDESVYVVGSFSDWEAREENRLDYDKESRSYRGILYLKNGFYDYYYALKGEDGLDIKALEGSSYETENDYVFLVYYRAFGGRYDELLSVQKVNSNPNR